MCKNVHCTQFLLLNNLLLTDNTTNEQLRKFYVCKHCSFLLMYCCMFITNYSVWRFLGQRFVLHINIDNSKGFVYFFLPLYILAFKIPLNFKFHQLRRKCLAIHQCEFIWNYVMCTVFISDAKSLAPSPD